MQLRLNNVWMLRSSRFSMRIRQLICFRSGATIFVTAVIAALIMATILYYQMPLLSEKPVCYTSSEYLAADLAVVLHALQMAHEEGLPPAKSSLKSIQQILIRLNPELYPIKKLQEYAISETPVVCPEVYTNRTFGIPYYENEKGWITLPCQAPPIEKVVTIVLNPLTEKNCSQHLDWILKGMSRHYPTVSVYVATTPECPGMAAKDYSNSHRVPTFPDASPGNTWTKLLSMVKTPYVFVARNLFHFSNFSRLERLVRIVSNHINTPVAGSTTRNLSGHWNIGCFQTRMSNYILQYVEGYHLSKNECMFCDYLSGPFVARTDIFQHIPLNPTLSEKMIFHDFFLELKNADYKAVNCPDAMNFANNVDSMVYPVKDWWMPMARKWELNLFLFSRGIRHELSCEESGLTCDRKITKSYLIPLCCRKEYLKALTVLTNSGILYEFRDGDVLAVVKMRGSIPWDTDTDLNVQTPPDKLWIETKEKLKEINYKFEEIDDWLSVRLPNTHINIDPINQLSSTVLLPEELQPLPTLVEYDGAWLVGPVSPGLYARNSYGVEILRHVQSYSIYGHSNPYEAYNSGRFLPCPKPRHHACLDHFSTDGNIQFMVP